jgi:hypothetical protein
MLHSFTVKERTKAASEPGDIEFNGRNLLTPEVMKDEFIPLHGGLYLELWAVHYDIDHEHIYTDATLTAVRPI